MTRKEQTGIRDLTFSQWIRDKLPDSNTGFLVSDLDFILWNYKTRHLMLLEVKTHGRNVRYWQSSLFEMIDNLIKCGIHEIKAHVTYMGFHIIQFENASFEDGWCTFDGTPISEQELIKVLSMVD